MSDLHTIAVTMGDPAGVGPELCLRLAAHAIVGEISNIAIIGNARLLQRVGRKCGLAVPGRVASWDRWIDGDATDSDPPLTIVDCPDGLGDVRRVMPGQIDAACGRAAYCYIECGVEAASRGRAAALATAPIHKEALAAAGVPFPGHTEILADKTGTENYCMMLTSDEITVSLVTTHVGICDVASGINSQRILDVIRLSDRVMRRICGRRPRLIVCGLNPHAGEHGLFGAGEEEKFITPSVEAARNEGIDIEGPLAPDTAFLPSLRETTDAYICMYHDQGLIPLKMLAFDRGVNITLGLPIIRTSVDHGTAFDIAWSGQAQPESLIQAVRLASLLADNAADTRQRK